MKESNGKSAFLFLCVFLSSYAIINGNTRIFVRQPPFDSFVCVTEQQYGYRRSRVMCSDACAQASGCIGFFYETVSGICNGTLVIHTNPSVCQFLNYGVGYYSDGKSERSATIKLGKISSKKMSNRLLLCALLFANKI